MPEHLHDLALETVNAENQRAHLRNSPSSIYSPRLYPDGDQWCALLGEDIQSGVCGFGDTPERAMAAFDVAWETSLKEPSQ